MCKALFDLLIQNLTSRVGADPRVCPKDIYLSLEGDKTNVPFVPFERADTGVCPYGWCNLSLYKVTLAFCDIDALGGMQNPFRRHSSLVGEMLGKGTTGCVFLTRDVYSGIMVTSTW